MREGGAQDVEQSLRPRPVRVLLNTVATLVLAVGLVAWATRGLSFEELRAGLEGIRPAWVVPPLALFALCFFTLDVLGFGLAWRRHLAPDMPWPHVRAIVCGKQVLFALVPLLTKAVAPLYFWRHRRIHPLRALGASELISASEVAAVMLLVSVTLLVSDVAIGPGLTAVVGGWWLVTLMGLAWLWSPWLRDTLPGLRRASLLHAFTRATPSELALQLGLRAAYQCVSLGCLWLLLVGMGARLSASQLLAFGPLFLLSGFLPISLAGYGGPQGLAVALLAERWQLLPQGKALAFSLVWSTGLLFVETGVGVTYLSRLLRLLKVSVRDGKSDEASAPARHD